MRLARSLLDISPAVFSELTGSMSPSRCRFWRDRVPSAMRDVGPCALNGARHRHKTATSALEPLQFAKEGKRGGGDGDLQGDRDPQA
jgi:hypothetical protein